MGSIVVFENVSLDGVTQDPTGEEGFNPKDWRDRLDSGDRDKFDELLLDDASGAQALLVGRRTYEFFAARYPYRTSALAHTLNSLPKYVVSSSLADPDWNNSTVLDGDIVDEVSKLKHTVNGEINRARPRRRAAAADFPAGDGRRKPPLRPAHRPHSRAPKTPAPRRYPDRR
jgi:dihydrofolate reductase